MSNVAALLGTLLCTNADINYYTQQQIYWADKYEANEKLLNKQVKYETQWESAYNSVYNCDSDSKDFKVGQQIIATQKDAGNSYKAEAYANAKVSQYDEEYSIELAEKDMEYETMKDMYETLLETLRAQQETEKQATSTAAQDQPGGGQ